MKHSNTCFLLVFSSLLIASHGPGDAVAQSNLVSIEVGDLPIILSAPHGGKEGIPGVPPRLGVGVSSFKNQTDTNTALLTRKAADALKKRLGKRPYTVIARFHRKYLDANRREQDAYESEHAKQVYEDYHEALSAARREVIERWGHGLLVDIHGQSSLPQAIVRGTQNGKTTTHLVHRFGREALIGETSLFGNLSKQGFPVIPAVGSDDIEHPNYDGGYIVQHYGSLRDGTLDAIQLEVGRQLRSKEVIPATANKLASAMSEFADEYLPNAERAVPTAPDELPSRDQIRVGVYADKGTGRSLTKLLSALASFKDVNVKKLRAKDIRSGVLTDFDVLIHPGGSGGEQGRHLEEAGRNQIREFIEQGGGFIGICAGAYLASADYSWSLNILDAKVLDRKHWARGTGMVELSLTDMGRTALRTDQQQLTIYYAQGPLLAPANRDDIADYQTIATFKTEIAKKGAPKGVMTGTTAIAVGKYGNGHVICFSPHPELTKDLESLVLHAIHKVKRAKTKVNE